MNPLDFDARLSQLWFLLVGLCRARHLDGSQPPMDVISPYSQETTHLPILVYFHGGGWSSGDKKLPENLLRISVSTRIAFRDAGRFLTRMAQPVLSLTAFSPDDA